MNHVLSASRRWAVVTTKCTGVEVVFNTYPSEREAELVVAQLAAVRCPARAEPARATDVAGCSRRA